MFFFFFSCTLVYPWYVVQIILRVILPLFWNFLFQKLSMSHCDFETCEGLDGWNPQKGLKLFFMGCLKLRRRRRYRERLKTPKLSVTHHNHHKVSGFGQITLLWLTRGEDQVPTKSDLGSRIMTLIKQKLFWLKKIMMFLLKYRWFTGLQFSHSGIDAIPRQKQWVMSLEFELGPCLTFHNQPIMSNVWWNGGISVARKTYNSKGTKLEAS